jgi:RES domain
VILYRCFAWDERAGRDVANGPLWFPRPFQGAGRHDNPDVYGCLYVSAHEASAVVEQLAQFRGNRFLPTMLVRRGLPLALAAIELSDRALLVDLDEPRVLEQHELRPSLVATHRRDVTQPQALALYRATPRPAGVRWWSSFEALWTNVTLFDRVAARLRLGGVRRLGPDDAALVEAADFLGLT